MRSAMEVRYGNFRKLQHYDAAAKRYISDDPLDLHSSPVSSAPLSNSLQHPLPNTLHSGDKTP